MVHVYITGLLGISGFEMVVIDGGVDVSLIAYELHW